MSSFSIKSDNSSDHLTIYLPSKTSYEEWLHVEIEIRAGRFGGRFEAEFTSHDFPTLRSDLRELYRTLSANLTFATLEGQLGFKINGDGLGHFEADCEAQESWNGSRLIFNLKFDQTHIPRMIRELDEILL